MKQFKTESKRILDLMVNSIYTNKEIFLRELISNASDAIDKLKFISLTDGSVNTDFKIKLSIDKAARTLTIEDNGIGMSEEELEKNLGTIAESGTLAFKKENDDKNGELIGQFGVGFYSAFMVADKIEVYSKKYGEDKAHKWTSAGAEGYTIEETEKDGFGTKIVITIKPDGEDYDYCEFLDEYKIIRLVKEYSDYIRYPIEMPVTRSRKKEGSPDDKPEYEDYTEIQILNSMVPLWKKPKAEVTDEKLAEFYKNEFHDYEAPVKSIYAKIEGTVSFDALLFVPARAPYNFYSKDYKRGLKLYSNGVMIMEACEDLLPDYLGFVKGVIESPDLSLNISREILQQDRQVKAIASSVEKKIIAELKKMQESERENYEKLFDTFGLSLKFGVYSGFGMNKDKLKDLLLFRSSKTGGAVTLKEYVETLPEGQTEILYACGESYERIADAPKVKKAIEKGLAVLYFKDDVDEFVAKVLGDYDGKKFKSVAEADFSVVSEAEKEETAKKAEEYKAVTDKMKEVLKDKVKDVKISGDLSSYPACLTSGGDISIEMEKVLNSMPGADGKLKAEKILELNADHKVLEKLKSLCDSGDALFDKYAEVLYEQARLLEGLSVDSVSDFVSAVSDIIG